MKVTLVNWNYDNARYNRFLPNLIPYLMTSARLTESGPVQIVLLNKTSFKLITRDTSTTVVLREQDYNALAQQCDPSHGAIIHRGSYHYQTDYYEQDFVMRHVKPIYSRYKTEIALRPDRQKQLQQYLHDFKGQRLFSHLIALYLKLDGVLFYRKRYQNEKLMLQKLIHSYALYHTQRDLYLFLYDCFRYRLLNQQRHRERYFSWLWHFSAFRHPARHQQILRLEQSVSNVISQEASQLEWIQALISVRDEISLATEKNAKNSELKAICDSHITKQKKQYLTQFNALIQSEWPNHFAGMIAQYTKQTYQRLTHLLSEDGLNDLYASIESRLTQLSLHNLDIFQSLQQFMRRLWPIVTSRYPSSHHSANAILKRSLESNFIVELTEAYQSNYFAVFKCLENRIIHGKDLDIDLLIQTLYQDLATISDAAFETLLQSRLFPLVYFYCPTKSERLHARLLHRIQPFIKSQPRVYWHRFSHLFAFDTVQNTLLEHQLLTCCLNEIIEQGRVKDLASICQSNRVSYRVSLIDKARCWAHYAHQALTDRSKISWLASFGRPSEQQSLLMKGLTKADVLPRLQDWVPIAQCIERPQQTISQLKLNPRTTTWLHQHPKTKQWLLSGLTQAIVSILMQPTIDQTLRHQGTQMRDVCLGLTDADHFFNTILQQAGDSLAALVKVYCSPSLDIVSANTMETQAYLRQYYRERHYQWFLQVNNSFDLLLQGHYRIRKYLKSDLPYILQALSTQDEKARLCTRMIQLHQNPQTPEIMANYFRVLEQMLRGQQPTDDYEALRTGTVSLLGELAKSSLALTPSAVIQWQNTRRNWRPQGDSNPCCRRERAVS